MRCSLTFSTVLYMTTSTPTVGALFAGYDGIGMGLQQVIPHRVAWFSENDAAPSKVLAHGWPTIPNLGDMTAVDWSAVEPVDVITGGFPCQDLSLAGKQAGMHAATRSGLWAHMAAAIETIRPSLVIAENVRGLLSGKAHSAVEQCPGCLDGSRAGHIRALGVVLGDLAKLGYDAQWIGLRASDVGAPHQRFRVFVVAHLADANGIGRQRAGSAWRWGTGPTNSGITAANPEGVGRSERRSESAGRAGQLVPASDSASVTDADDSRRDGRAPDEGWSAVERTAATRDSASDDCIDWGNYQPAIERWEPVVGRHAPRPTEIGSRGGERLSPTFVEWMMGLPAGHVTDPAIGLSRANQLKILGNGVVPQQAAAAIGHLLSMVPA